MTHSLLETINNKFSIKYKIIHLDYCLSEFFYISLQR
nr:MAG TPA: hypothetical protein [Crassvirales sp.]